MARSRSTPSRADTRYRVQIQPIGSANQLLIVAAPLNEADDTLHRLLIVEVAVALSVLTAVFLLGLWLVRVGLRPLGRIETTAAAIAGGDLSQRVENDDPRTEVGRLGGALNTMLGQIEEAFDERTASENRLRRFVADASHELRTPLAAVRAYAELFDRGARERPDDLERAMTGIQRESRRMGLLVDDLLLLARLDQGRPLERKPVEIEEIARDAVEAARTLDPGREIELDAPEPVEVQGDRERLRQILDNLLANVRAHTPAGSGATVRVRNGGAAAVLEVADSGPGLSDEQLEHAFERFYRGDSSRSRDAGGAGLGLAIAAAIAESHGGSATVVNEGRDGGTGLTVRVTIPLVPPAEPTPAVAIEDATLEPAPTACRLAAADRREHVDARVGLERRLQPGPLAVDVDVDVRTQPRPGLAEPVAHAGPLLVEPCDRVVHARRLHVEPARQVDEQRRQRRRQVHVGHRYPITATSTEEIAGR